LFGPPFGTGTVYQIRAFGAGDANFDGLVDIFDVNLVSAHWGESGPTGDVNGDGAVDIFDINSISANWTANAGSGSAAVPEPSTVVLVFVGALSLLISPTRRGTSHAFANGSDALLRIFPSLSALRTDERPRDCRNPSEARETANGCDL
jgi:hypothetical protein